MKAPRGKDGDHLDVFIGDDPESTGVWVINQHKLEGGFDEVKIMLGFRSRQEAVEAYDKAFSDGLGPKLRDSVVSTTIDGLKAWLEKGDTKKEFKAVSEALAAPAWLAEHMRALRQSPSPLLEKVEVQMVASARLRNSARFILEGETAKQFIGRHVDPVKTRAARIDAMRFKSKDEVKVGTRVLYRMVGYGSNRDPWDKESDEYYRISGSDHWRVGSFWFVPRGQSVDSWGVKQVPKARSTHLELVGVAGAMLSWKEFFRDCLKPELYYPKRKSNRLAFEVPPDQRE